MKRFLTRITPLAGAIALLALPFATAATAADGPGRSEPRVTRVLYLQNISSGEATRILRKEVRIRQIAQWADRNLVVIKGTADEVDRCESALRERAAVAERVDPHPPEGADSQAGPRSARVFELENIDPGTAIAFLRAIYEVREVSGASDDVNRVTVRASRPILESSQALLDSLGVLTAATDGPVR